MTLTEKERRERIKNRNKKFYENNKNRLQEKSYKNYYIKNKILTEEEYEKNRDNLKIYVLLKNKYDENTIKNISQLLNQ
jgi:hypothetical protein